MVVLSIAVKLFAKGLKELLSKVHKYIECTFWKFCYAMLRRHLYWWNRVFIDNASSVQVSCHLFPGQWV